MQHQLGQFLFESVFLVSGLLCSFYSQAQEFPEGEGRDLVFSACAACHGLENITAPHQKLTAEEWEIYLYDMVAKGANLDTDQMEVVRRYLVENFAVDK